MQIDKDMILNLLREQGDHQRADEASRELPDQVDIDQHGNLLERFGINPMDLISRFGGGKGLGGLLGG